MDASPGSARSPDDAKAHAPNRHWRRRAEIIAGVLLATATVFAAWTGFQNAQWVRERFDLSDRASSIEVEASELSIAADLDERWDQSVFVDWATALIEDRPAEAIAYELLFRDNTRPLLQAWQRSYARDPQGALEVGPFSTGVYDVDRRRQRAATKRDAARALSRDSRAASQNAADYALLMVFFAGALTFVGLTALFRERRVRWLTLGLASLSVSTGVLLIVQLPVLV